MSKESISIKLLNREYPIKCTPNNAKDLKQAAEFLDKMLSQHNHNNSKNFTDVLVICALNISNMLLQVTEKNSDDYLELEKKLDSLHQKVKKALESA